MRISTDKQTPEITVEVVEVSDEDILADLLYPGTSEALA